MGTEGWQNTVQKHVFTTGQLPLHFQRCSRGNASFLSHSFGDRKQDIGGLRLSPRPPLKQLVVLKKEKENASERQLVCFVLHCKKRQIKRGIFFNLAFNVYKGENDESKLVKDADCKNTQWSWWTTWLQHSTGPDPNLKIFFNVGFSFLNVSYYCSQCPLWHHSSVSGASERRMFFFLFRGSLLTGYRHIHTEGMHSMGNISLFSLQVKGCVGTTRQRRNRMWCHGGSSCLCLSSFVFWEREDGTCSSPNPERWRRRSWAQRQVAQN